MNQLAPAAAVHLRLVGFGTGGAEGVRKFRFGSTGPRSLRGQPRRVVRTRAGNDVVQRRVPVFAEAAQCAAVLFETAFLFGGYFVPDDVQQSTVGGRRFKKRLPP